MLSRNHNNEYWNLKVHKPPLKDFKSVSRKPCLIVKDNDEYLMRNTTPEKATFWSVYLSDSAGETFAVADCKDELTAIEFENWIMYILKLLSGKRFL